jgi:hypothetical protein
MSAEQGLRSTTGLRPVYLRATVPVEIGAVPRTGLPWRPYVYRGTGVDQLTPELDALPDAGGPALSKGMERYLRADVDHLSIAKAAAVVGVSKRAILRYRAALRALAGAS